MTKSERRFLMAFAKVANPRTWKVTEDGMIRHRTGHCPLSWVAHLEDNSILPCKISAPALILGLTDRMASRIADAADDCAGKRSQLRKAMVAAIR